CGFQRGASENPPASEYSVTVVAYAGLAGRHAPRGSVEHNLSAALAIEGENRRQGRLGGAQFRGDAQAARPWRGIAEPIHMAEAHARLTQRRARRHHHAAALRLEAHDVERLCAGKAEALALAHREMDDAVVATEDAAFEVDDLAGLCGLGPQFLHHGRIVA